jgi:transcriptional regulator with XRE-family HTH domain
MDELRRLRTLRGFTQKELGQATGVDPSTVNQLEGGRRAPSIYTLAALARGLGCEVRDLFAPGYAPPPRKAVAV